MPALVASSLGILLTINAGVASAGIGVLRPGAGNNPPKTPDWNVKNQEGGSGAVTTKDGKSVQKLDKSKKTTVTMLSVMLGERVFLRSRYLPAAILSWWMAMEARYWEKCRLMFLPR